MIAVTAPSVGDPAFQAKAKPGDEEAHDASEF
jgi:hypothetical protein